MDLVYRRCPELQASVVVDVGRAEEALHHGALGGGVFEGPAPQGQENSDEPLCGEWVSIVVAEHFGSEAGNGG